MMKTQALKRLLWKEAREDWLVMLILVLAPLILFRSLANARVGMYGYRVYSFLALFSSPVTVVLWAAWKGGEKKNEQKMPLYNLPVSVGQKWGVQILLPLTIAVFAGAWYGVMSTYATHWHNTALMAKIGSIHMAAGFAIAYLLAAAISGWISLLVGFIWAITILDCAKYIAHNTPQADFLWNLLSRSLIGAIVALGLFLVLNQMKRLRMAQIISVILLASVIFGPYARDAWNMWRTPPEFQSLPLQMMTATNMDNSLRILPETVAHNSKETRLRLIDYRYNKNWTQDFPNQIMVIGLAGRDCVYLAQQSRDESDARILAWHPKAYRDNVEEIARISAGKSILQRTKPEYYSSISPDGYYVMFILKSRLGQSYDTWIIDTRNGTGNIIQANMFSTAGKPRWTKKHLYIPHTEGILAVDLTTLRTEYLNIPNGREVNRI